MGGFFSHCKETTGEEKDSSCPCPFVTVERLWSSTMDGAAQMGILGLMVHEKLDNNPYIITILFVSCTFQLYTTTHMSSASTCDMYIHYTLCFY